MMASEKTSRFLTGFFVGASVGALGSLLFSPRSGADARRTLSKDGGRFPSPAFAALGRLRVNGGKAYENARRTFDAMVEELKENGVRTR